MKTLPLGNFLATFSKFCTILALFSSHIMCALAPTAFLAMSFLLGLLETRSDGSKFSHKDSSFTCMKGT